VRNSFTQGKSLQPAAQIVVEMMEGAREALEEMPPVINP